MHSRRFYEQHNSLAAIQTPVHPILVYSSVVQNTRHLLYHTYYGQIAYMFPKYYEVRSQIIKRQTGLIEAEMEQLPRDDQVKIIQAANYHVKSLIHPRGNIYYTRLRLQILVKSILQRHRCNRDSSIDCQ